jgi:hypothetical protein
MAHKQKSEKVNWLLGWEKILDWSGKTKDQIDAYKLQIENYVKAYIAALDLGKKISKPSFPGHGIEFDWSHEPDSQFKVSAYLTPPATEKATPGGGGQTQLSPTPPPQP